MVKKTNVLSEALKEFQEKLQKNEDALGNLMEQRELIRKAPANKVDVLKRIENIIKSMSDRYLDTHRGDMQKLVSCNDCDEFNINLFTKTKKVEGVILTLFDSDALAFFHQESLLVASGALSEVITLSGAGLPFDEREKEIKALDKKIFNLEVEKESLFLQAAEAGLVVQEEYAAL